MLATFTLLSLSMPAAQQAGDAPAPLVVGRTIRGEITDADPRVRTPTLDALHGVRGEFELSLAICEQAAVPEHVSTATTLDNLAFLLADLGDYTAARELHERALAICEQFLGPEHPLTATSLVGLATVLWEQLDLAAARTLYETTGDGCRQRSTSRRSSSTSTRTISPRGARASCSRAMRLPRSA